MFLKYIGITLLLVIAGIILIILNISFPVTLIGSALIVASLLPLSLGVKVAKDQFFTNKDN